MFLFQRLSSLLAFDSQIHPFFFLPDSLNQSILLLILFLVHYLRNHLFSYRKRIKITCFYEFQFRATRTRGGNFLTETGSNIISGIFKPNYKWSNMAPISFPREFKKNGLSKDLDYKEYLRKKVFEWEEYCLLKYSYLLKIASLKYFSSQRT